MRTDQWPFWQSGEDDAEAASRPVLQQGSTRLFTVGTHPLPSFTSLHADLDLLPPLPSLHADLCNADLAVARSVLRHAVRAEALCACWCFACLLA